METTWIYLINPMMEATDNSYKKASQIDTFHFNALDANKAEPAISVLLDEYTPFHINFANKYAKRIQQKGSQKGDTKAFKKLLNDITSQVNNWDIKISNVYAPDTTEYSKLFPNGHKPFLKGKYFERVNVVKVLIDEIGTDPKLADIKAIIQTYYNALFASFNGKDVAQKTTGTTSDDLEQARIDMCNQQYKNLGKLMELNFLNPVATEKYFDLETIRNKKQMVFVKQLIHDAFAMIVNRTQKAAQKIRITSNQNTIWYLSNTRTALVGTAQQVPANIPTVLDVDIFVVNLKTNKYLIGKNLSSTEVAEIKVEIL